MICSLGASQLYKPQVARTCFSTDPQTAGSRCFSSLPGDPAQSTSAIVASSANPSVRLSHPLSHTQRPTAELRLPEVQLSRARSLRRTRNSHLSPSARRHTLGSSFLSSSIPSHGSFDPSAGEEGRDRQATHLPRRASFSPPAAVLKDSWAQKALSTAPSLLPHHLPEVPGMPPVPTALHPELLVLPEEHPAFSTREDSGGEQSDTEMDAEGPSGGWSADSYIRGLMGLWGGLRGHAKVAMKEQQDMEEEEEEEEEEDEESQDRGAIEEEWSAEVRAFLAEDLGLPAGDDSMEPVTEAPLPSGGQGAAPGEETSEEEALDEALAEGVEGPSPVKAPPKANVWALWALMTWRKEKQLQEKQLQQQQHGPTLDESKVDPAVVLAPAGEEESDEVKPSDVVKAVRGTSSCSTCQACEAYAAAAAAVPGVPQDGAAVTRGAVVAPHTAESMGRFLHEASLAELRTAAVMSRLCHLAYTIPKLNEDYLFMQHRMRVVTTSLRRDEVQAMRRAGESVHAAVEARALQEVSEATAPAAGQVAVEASDGTSGTGTVVIQRERSGGLLPAAASTVAKGAGGALGLVSQAYSTTASALASAAGAYAPQAFGSKGASTAEGQQSKEDVKEKVEKGKAGEEDKGTCPCNWYACDEVKSGTRHFVIQGSESLASWQANLTFDPAPFEDPRLGVVVHRGIYMAAKALYRELLPLIRAHLAVHGRERARIQLVGHSLGGSLATLLGLMLHLRGEVTPEIMLPVYTFGSPSVMCGGDQLLAKLGLPVDSIRQVVMHRDLVPRAFACEYPGHIAEMLRRVSGALRNHPCLLSQRLVYAPMGHMMVLQPDAQAAPFHPLLPQRPGLFHLQHPSLMDSLPRNSEEQLAALDGGPERLRAQAELRGAQLAFLNNPHPLEILADPASYGTEGQISRDHDPRHYTFALASQARRLVRESRREERRQRRLQHWLPILQSGTVPERLLLGPAGVFRREEGVFETAVRQRDPYSTTVSDEEEESGAYPPRPDKQEVEVLPHFAPSGPKLPSLSSRWGAPRVVAAGALGSGGGTVLSSSGTQGPASPNSVGNGEGTPAGGRSSGWGWWPFWG